MIDSLKTIALLCSILGLIACSSGPSNKDIEQALEDQMDKGLSMAGSLLGEAVMNAAKTNVTIKNASCERADVDRYTCTFTMTVENDFTGKNITETSSTFVKHDGNWIISQNF